MKYRYFERVGDHYTTQFKVRADGSSEGNVRRDGRDPWQECHQTLAQLLDTRPYAWYGNAPVEFIPDIAEILHHIRAAKQDPATAEDSLSKAESLILAKEAEVWP